MHDPLQNDQLAGAREGSKFYDSMFQLLSITKVEIIFTTDTITKKAKIVKWRPVLLSHCGKGEILSSNRTSWEHMWDKKWWLTDL